MIRALIFVILTLVAIRMVTPAQAAPLRVWIDTDAACGLSATTDVDDCLALLAFARNRDVRIVGLSTTFGNAKRRGVDRVIAGLAPLWRAEFADPPPIYPGAKARGDCADNIAAAALDEALQSGPLTIIALGPLTNLACVLHTDPQAARTITRLVFVGGARAGHVFHPAEGARGAMLFGHGPIARDLNVQLDPRAVALVLASGIAITLTPYDLARQVEVDDAMLKALAAKGALSRAVATAAEPWLATWRGAIGRDGFYPFDAMAALAALAPRTLHCRSEPARVTADRAISGSRFGPQRLIVGAVDWAAQPARAVSWCDRITGPPKPVLHALYGLTP
jgi:purine nucleosidase